MWGVGAFPDALYMVKQAQFMSLHFWLEAMAGFPDYVKNSMFDTPDL